MMDFYRNAKETTLYSLHYVTLQRCSKIAPYKS